MLINPSFFYFFNPFFVIRNQMAAVQNCSLVALKTKTEMTSDDFAKGFYLERKQLLELYFKSDNNTDVSQLISSLQLDQEKTERLKQILNAVLRDAFYTVLLGLDGEAQIGNRQETYKILDEEGNELTGGEIEVAAWEYFHNNKFENSKS
jgi:hypothetical protein